MGTPRLFNPLVLHPRLHAVDRPVLMAFILMIAVFLASGGTVRAELTCFGEPATIIGTEGDDTLVGTSGNDVIVGLGGNDIIIGKGGNDLICGGDGNDTLKGRRGQDMLDGGLGDDILKGGLSQDILIGGLGNDALEGGAGQDTLDGGQGNDTLRGNVGADSLNGGPGNDKLNGGYGNDTLEGGQGDDTLVGKVGKDTLNGGEGNDVLKGNFGNDTLDGGNGIDTLDGGAGSDICLNGENNTRCEEEGFSQPAISITSPTAGSVISASTVIVQGVVDASVGTEIGVTVNGFVGLVSDGQFAALVPLEENVTSLTATATDATGSTGSDTISVTVQPPVSDLLFLTPSPDSGVAPLQVNLRASFLGLASNYQWDVDGNGTIDFSGPNLVEVNHEYQVPGLHVPTVIVTDSHGSQFTESAPVLVFSRDEVVALLQAKWQGFKDALRAGDILGALRFVVQDNRGDYQEIFQNLTVPLSAIDQVLTDIQFVQFRAQTAEFEMLRTDERGELSYLVRFVVDQDGIWRIKAL